MKSTSVFTLQLDEKLCSTLVASVRGIVWEAEPLTFRFSYVSPQAEQILGYPPRQWIEEPDFWRSHTHPDDVDWCSAYCRDASEKREDHEFEYRMVASDGRIVWLHDIVTVVPADDGSIMLRGIMIDITRQIRLLEDLKLREHYQRALLDNFPFAAWMKDELGRYLAANRQLAAYLDLESSKDLVGRTDFDVMPPDIAELVSEEDRKILKSGLTKRTEEQLPVKGENRWFEVYQSPVTIDDRVIGTVGCNWDITERKLMEQALKESEERHRKLVEISPDAVFIHTAGRFVFMNTAAARLLGAERPEDLCGRTALDFVHPDFRDLVKQRIENAWDHKDNPPIEERLVRLDGSTVPVEMVSVHFLYKGADSVLAVARDISERKKMQDELVKAQKLESLGVLAGGIAHDFNNILTGIMGNVSLILNQLEPSSGIAKRLESCEKAAIRASELTQQLLTFARGGEPVRRLIEPASLISESASFVLRGSSVRCEIVMADDLWCIDADSGQISQVLNNILINASQSMPGGGVALISATNESLGPLNRVNLPAGDYLKIVIEDHGCGIPPENLSKIFDPYFTTKESGSGLGLASVYSIVRRHGGAVAASSTKGVGSCFTIHLPAVSEKRPDVDMTAKEGKLAGTGRILVMDDEEIIREIASEILRFAGYDVEVCTNGGEAVEQYRKAYDRNAPFNAVIMDLTVPGGMGGKEAASLILKIDPDASLIVSSGYSNDPVVANFHQFGFSGAVVKPFSAYELTTEVKRSINGNCR